MGRNTWQRREFLTTALGSLAGLGLAPLTAGRAYGIGRGRLGALSPRTIGLRTFGGDFRFDPPGLLIESDASVTWLNMGDFHTTTAFHPENAELLSGGVPLRIPEGAEPWHSGMLGLTAGTEFTHTFEVEGVYDYFCQPHYSFGMVGRIIVGGPHGGPAVRRPLSELNQASRDQMPEVETIMGPAGRTYEWAARINGVLLVRLHGEPVAPVARALRAGTEQDDVLQSVLGAERAGTFRARLERFIEAAVDGIDYETLVGRADDAKAVLRASIG